MEKIIRIDRKGVFEIDTKPASLLSDWEMEMLKYLERPRTARDVARHFSISDQLANYRIKRLLKKGLARESHKDIVNNILSRFYVASSKSFYTVIGEWEKMEKRVVLLNGKVVVVTGSPDPHGPLMARSRDIEHSTMLGAILGKYARDVGAVYDTLFTRDLAAENLFLLGGPIVNFISKRFNKSFRIRFGRDFSIIAGRKKFHGKNFGLLSSISNPLDEEKIIALVAGIGYNGTRASLLALEEFNIFSGLVHGKSYVVKGYDEDGDGRVDRYEVVMEK